MRLIRLLGLLALSTACAGPAPIVECTGNLTVTVALEEVPSNLRIVWNGEVARDDCAELHHGRFIVDEDENGLSIDDGGFGYRPPAELTLHIFDQGDCTSETLVFSAIAHQVAEQPPELCDVVQVDFAAADIQCCCEHVVEGDILTEDLLDSRVCTEERTEGRCVVVDPGRFTPHPCCPDATGATCGS